MCDTFNTCILHWLPNFLVLCFWWLNSVLTLYNRHDLRFFICSWCHHSSNSLSEFLVTSRSGALVPVARLWPREIANKLLENIIHPPVRYTLPARVWMQPLLYINPIMTQCSARSLACTSEHSQAQHIRTPLACQGIYYVETRSFRQVWAGLGRNTMCPVFTMHDYSTVEFFLLSYDLPLHDARAKDLFRLCLYCKIFTVDIRKTL